MQQISESPPPFSSFAGSGEKKRERRTGPPPCPSPRPSPKRVATSALKLPCASVENTLRDSSRAPETTCSRKLLCWNWTGGAYDSTRGDKSLAKATTGGTRTPAPFGTVTNNKGWEASANREEEWYERIEVGVQWSMREWHRGRGDAKDSRQLEGQTTSKGGDA